MGFAIHRTHSTIDLLQIFCITEDKYKVNMHSKITWWLWLSNCHTSYYTSLTQSCVISVQVEKPDDSHPLSDLKLFSNIVIKFDLLSTFPVQLFIAKWTTFSETLCVSMPSKDWQCLKPWESMQVQDIVHYGTCRNPSHRLPWNTNAPALLDAIADVVSVLPQPTVSFNFSFNIISRIAFRSGKPNT